KPTFHGVDRHYSDRHDTSRCHPSPDHSLREREEDTHNDGHAPSRAPLHAGRVRRCFWRLYSYRRATIGSTLAARQAGIAHAARATPPTTTVATPYVTGSFGVIP